MIAIFSWTFALGNCPENYEYQQGDAKGTQYAIRGPSGLLYSPFSSINDCARICDGITACKAIEWSPSELKCVLINTADSSGPKYLDYEFCRKGLWEGMFTDVDTILLKFYSYKSHYFIVTFLNLSGIQNSESELTTPFATPKSSLCKSFLSC